MLGVQQYEELSVVRWNIWCKPFLTLTYTPSARSVTGFISQYLKYLKLHLFVFPMFMNFFQLIHVILKILNIANKSNYLLQQHYFNHFHFTWKCFFWNKNQTKLHKLNRRSKTMVGIPLNLHITAIFQSDELQLLLWYITLKWSDNFWKLLLWYPFRGIRIIAPENPDRWQFSHWWEPSLIRSNWLSEFFATLELVANFESVLF